jgi:hypothetical protein
LAKIIVFRPEPGVQAWANLPARWRTMIVPPVTTFPVVRFHAKPLGIRVAAVT